MEFKTLNFKHNVYNTITKVFFVLHFETFMFFHCNFCNLQLVKNVEKSKKSCQVPLRKAKKENFVIQNHGFTLPSHKVSSFKILRHPNSFSELSQVTLSKKI